MKSVPIKGLLRRDSARFRFFACALMLAACAGRAPPLPAPAPHPTVEASQQPPKKKDLLGAARAAGKLGLFADAVGEVHSATVFAPTDEAFSKVDPSRRGKVARHHIVPDTAIHAADLGADSTDLKAADGGTLSVRVLNGEIWVDDVRVIATLDTSDGALYAIGEVIDPANPPDLRTRIARISPSFAKLVLQSGLLDGSGPFTVFVPTDGALATLTPPIDAKKIVSRHTARGLIVAEDLPKLRTVRTLAGADVATAALHTLRAPSIASNGLVYVVDTILK